MLETHNVYFRSMELLSKVLYFLVQYWVWSFLIFLFIGALLAIWRKSIPYFVVGFLLAMLNLFTTQFLNASFLQKYGQYSTAVIAFSERTNSKLNDEYIWRYQLVVKSLEDQDVPSEFTTRTASLYPVRNQIYIPPLGEVFVVKFIPGFEKNIVVMTDESDFGKRAMRQKLQTPVLRSKGIYEANPENTAFSKAYRKELKQYIEHPVNAQDSLNIQKYKEIIVELEQ